MTGTADRSLSGVEHRLRTLVADRPPLVDARPAPAVVIIDLAGRRCARSGPSTGADAGPLDRRARLLEEGAGHLDALADLEQVMARAAAAQARELAAFARCRPSSWDRQPGERGAASAATRAARPSTLEPVSEWAAAEVAARLRLPQRVAATRLAEAVFLAGELPATLGALEAGTITPAHAQALVNLLQPVSEDKRAQVEAAALERAGTQTVDNLRARTRRIIARIDAAAALRRLVEAARTRAVTCYAGDDGMATLAALLPGPLARACHETLKAYARACAVDEEGNPDARSLDERMADCLVDLILRPHADRPPVQIALTVLAGVETLTGAGAGADEPGEVDGDVVPAAVVRELAQSLGLLPRPGTPGSTDDGGVDSTTPVDRSETGPVPGDAATEERIARLQAAEEAAAADLAAAMQTEEPGEPAVACRGRRAEALARLLAVRTLTGTALAHRPRVALAEQLSGTLLALTDAVELRQAATTGLGLGPPPPTDAYRPPDALARFVKLRDRRCRFPGCRAHARCADLDHQVPHPHGPTAHDNLACLCEHHHRLSHQAPGWRLRRDDRGGLVWTLPGGHTVSTSPPALGAGDAPATTVRPAPDDRVARRRRTDRTLDAIRNWRPGAGAPDPGIPF